MAQHVTNKQLRRLLRELGFQQGEHVEDTSLTYRHDEAGTVLLLPSNREDQPVRTADLMSVRTHLVHRGPLDQPAFDRFVDSGILHTITKTD